MHITEHNSNKSTVEFVIELDRVDIEQDLQKAAKHLAEHTAIPGFRAGLAPYDVVSCHLGGEAKIYEEALQAIVSRSLSRIIAEKKLETVGRPEISIQKMVPPFGITYKAVVNLLPTVELGDVSQIKVESKEVTVTAEEIEKITRELRQEKEAAEKERFELACMEELLKISKVGELSEDMINEEIEKMIHELEHSVESRGLKFADYLASIKKTKDDLQKDFRSKAEHRLKIGLVARVFGREENIVVDEAEINKEIELMKKHYQHDPAAVKQFDSPEYRDYIRNVLTSRAIFSKLSELVKTAK